AATQAAHAARGRRRPSAGDHARRARDGALRRRDPDGGTDGPGRRPRRRARVAAAAPAAHHARNVRERARALEADGGNVSHAFALFLGFRAARRPPRTIGYSILPTKRPPRLKADEQALKATISELITATEIAERAIAGLKLTVRDCDQNLG